LAYEPIAVLTTHHHADHAGGNERFKRDFPDIEVYGPRDESIPALTLGVQDSDTFRIGGLEAQVIGTPGHTNGHVSYLIETNGDATMPTARVVCADTEASRSEGLGPVPTSSAGALFCGDTLFVAGCGRLFEGLPEHMHASLSRLAAVAPSTRVFCGHEYTLDNLAFAAAADPTSELVRKKLALCSELRERGLPTVPSTIADELALNPFLRTGDEGIRAALTAATGEEFTSKSDPVRVFGGLRAWKDRFRAVQ
jgi:hydroxyacylglutathione hydrolase